jgi:hypothetical protein
MLFIRVEAVTGPKHWLEAVQGRIEAQFMIRETRAQ